MKPTKSPQLVLSLYPTSRGLGFAVFDSPQNLVDWGYSDIRWNKRVRSIQKLKSLVDLYQPEVLILEDTKIGPRSRGRRIRTLIHALTQAAIGWQLPVYHYSPEQLHEAFNTQNRDTRAKCIANALPELKPYLPTKRNFWDKPHPQMQMFDAVSLALTYFYLDT